LEQRLCDAQADSAGSASDDGDGLLAGFHRMSFWLNLWRFNTQKNQIITAPETSNLWGVGLGLSQPRNPGSSGHNNLSRMSQSFVERAFF
jgi:hypothetical protein